MAGIFNELFNANIFNGAEGAAGEEVAEDVVKTGTGGIDPDKRSRRIHLPFKPTGLIDRPIKEGRKNVEDYVDESRQIQADVAAQLAREFGEESQALEAREQQEQAEEAAQLAIAQMTQAEIDREIGVRLRKKLKDEEDELIMIMTILGHVV